MSGSSRLLPAGSRSRRVPSHPSPRRSGALASRNLSRSVLMARGWRIPSRASRWLAQPSCTSGTSPTVEYARSRHRSHHCPDHPSCSSVGRRSRPAAGTSRSRSTGQTSTAPVARDAARSTCTTSSPPSWRGRALIPQGTRVPVSTRVVASRTTERSSSVPRARLRTHPAAGPCGSWAPTDRSKSTTSARRRSATSTPSTFRPSPSAATAAPSFTSDENPEGRRARRITRSSSTDQRRVDRRTVDSTR